MFDGEWSGNRRTGFGYVIPHDGWMFDNMQLGVLVVIYGV